MATIDYKQKIKDYMNSSEVDTLYKSMLNNLFPELAESEDKRIRKAIIKIIGDIDGGFQFEKYGILKKDALAWLIKEAKGNEGEIPISELNPADKVEPKFNAGDWIYHEISGNAFHINRIENRTYISDEGATISFGRQKDWRLWIIQDAKDGDVLACENDIVIFKENSYNPKDKSGCMFVYCSCNNFYEIGGINPTDYKPATKEQRDLLFQKMKEAGYEWSDKDKKLIRAHI